MNTNEQQPAGIPRSGQHEDLTDLGWNDHFAEHFEALGAQVHRPARVVCEHTHIYTVIGPDGKTKAEISGRMMHQANSRLDYPSVGDWVAMKPGVNGSNATIHALLPRTSAFLRKVAGVKTEEQVVAANIDTVFLVSGLDGDYNPRRIERYLTPVWDTGATPVVVLNKADLCTDVEAHVQAAQDIAFGVSVLAVSAARNEGVDALLEHVGPGKTAAFLGSSGVGKSSLINCLLGVERMLVNHVREDDSRGRHTTTHRERISLPGHGMLMDTPGMRELQLWADEDGLSRSFEDIEDLALQCRFRDCSHGREPGCAIRNALDTGELDTGRWRSYLKLKREIHHLAVRQDDKLALAEKTKRKKFAVQVRRRQKEK